LLSAFKGAVSALSSIGTLVWGQIKATLPSVGIIVDYISNKIGGGKGGKKAGGF